MNNPYLQNFGMGTQPMGNFSTPGVQAMPPQGGHQGMGGAHMAPPPWQNGGPVHPQGFRQPMGDPMQWNTGGTQAYNPGNYQAMNTMGGQNMNQMPGYGQAMNTLPSQPMNSMYGQSMNTMGNSSGDPGGMGQWGKRGLLG